MTGKRKPVKKKATLTKRVAPVEPKDTEARIWFLILAIACILAGAGVVYVNVFLNKTSNMFTISWGFAVIMILIALPCLKAWSAFGKIDAEARIKYQEKTKEYDDAIKAYDAEVMASETQFERDTADYNDKMKAAEEEYRRQCSVAEANFERAKVLIEQMKVPLAETKEILQRLYELDFIFPKYRNLVAVSTFYEYFTSGRVTALTGPDGAYNLYEAETRQNTVITNLEQINSQLEEIKQNQFILYEEMNRTNSLISGITKDVRGILQATDSISSDARAEALDASITASCAEAIAENTEALKYLSLFGK